MARKTKEVLQKELDELKAETGPNELELRRYAERVSMLSGMLELPPGSTWGSIYEAVADLKAAR